jgi:hypothetical protein
MKSAKRAKMAALLEACMKKEQRSEILFLVKGDDKPIKITVHEVAVR